ncbi:hypothetical protein EDS67_13915 [candidate division KSB1 bacterium]|nr:MAG: hypothetical protein EDS67_13915 [candidate division KSB1 bacterium]MBC6948857.1 hypothetical protein [candidate division KSB1 bacterium]MCE7942449.1 hypothetical protein [Chlorobi bacterium CHB1]
MTIERMRAEAKKRSWFCMKREMIVGLGKHNVWAGRLRGVGIRIGEPAAFPKARSITVNFNRSNHA